MKTACDLCLKEVPDATLRQYPFTTMKFCRRCWTGIEKEWEKERRSQYGIFNGHRWLKPRLFRLFSMALNRTKMVIKKNGWKMGIFILWWAVMGHIVIPYLLVISQWWPFSWVTYTPIDEMILFPIAAYFLMRGVKK